MSPRVEHLVLRLWHAALAGGFVVAYVTGDEDTYAMHVFAGYWLLAALALRLVLAAFASETGPLRLPRPRLPQGKPGRNPMFAWMAAILLPALVLAGLSGVIADAIPKAEDLHEGLAQFGLWLVIGHAAIIAWIFQGRRVRQALTGGAAALVLLSAAAPAMAADPARDAIVNAYVKEAGQPASAARGEAIYRSKNTASPDFASCSTCHGDNPAAQGRHAKTGRVIEPVAISTNPKRFTDAAKVEERFGRDCQTVLGRACTAQDKADYIVFLSGK